MLGNLFKAVVGVATLPVDIAADVITLGGALTDKVEPYTATKVKRVYRQIDEASK